MFWILLGVYVHMLYLILWAVLLSVFFHIQIMQQKIKDINNISQATILSSIRRLESIVSYFLGIFFAALYLLDN